MGTLIGFDYGPRKIGVAVGQTLTGTASPVTTIRAVKNKPDWVRIDDLIGAWKPLALVVGIPYDSDGDNAVLVAQALRFSRQLSGRFGLRVHLVDERLTSREARQLMGKAAKRIEAQDAVAASLILETWLYEHQETFHAGR